MSADDLTALCVILGVVLASIGGGLALDATVGRYLRDRHG